MRLKNDSSVITLTLVPERGRDRAFGRPSTSPTWAAIPADIAFVRTDGGLRLAALVPARSAAVLIDPVTSLTTEVALPARYQSLSLVTDVAGGGAGARRRRAAVERGGAMDGVAFWELGQTAGRPYRSIETVGVDGGDRGGARRSAARRTCACCGARRPARSTCSICGTRTAAPLVTSTSSHRAHRCRRSGIRSGRSCRAGPRSSPPTCARQHPRSLLIERRVRQVFEVERAGGGASVIILHDQGAFGATVYDADTLDDATPPPLLGPAHGRALLMNRKTVGDGCP